MVDNDPDELTSDSVSDGGSGSAVVTRSSGIEGVDDSSSSRSRSEGEGESAVATGNGGWYSDKGLLGLSCQCDIDKQMILYRTYSRYHARRGEDQGSLLP